MDTRREFLKKASLLSGGAGLLNTLPASIAKAMAINPAAGSTFLDAEHIVFLMQENRSFDHTYGSLQGVRGFNDPRAITLPDKKPVWFQSNSKGETYAPFRLDIKNTNATWMQSLPHSWTDQVDARNNGRFDKWLDNKHSGVEKYQEMPLTLGYYSREDIPFYYSLADAFTVCDQNFCSSLTGTTPNRLYFWTGTIREKQEADSPALVWNSNADEDTPVSWTTFPERLEENGISWKIYQNEISTDCGLEDDYNNWLCNFGDNPIEYFSQFNVRSKPDELSGKDKALHEKAFCKNSKDPAYRELSTLKYDDGGHEREMTAPAGDILFQFREDVNNGVLPLVSWIVAPEKFSDHPSSAWYGAWYISEVLDILTKNPEVWKKTIFVLAYDENDGYFDHVPPFVPPHPTKEGTGKVSKGIDTSLEYVASAAQQISEPGDMRESPIGLGFRVPLVVASPWSRGGWVNSQVFDHTSSLQFLEKFLSNKFKKKIEEPNISQWRRTVCGDLTSVFRPYNNEKIEEPEFLKRDEFIKSIHKAQFKNNPSNFKKISQNEIDSLKEDNGKNLRPSQEVGTRNANALPYELYADGKLSADKKNFMISLGAGNKLFGSRSAGSPFTIYAPGKYKDQDVECWSYAVSAGDMLEDQWAIENFEETRYRLKVYGPNGFYRDFLGTPTDPDVDITVKHSAKPGAPGVIIEMVNRSSAPLQFELVDNSYGASSKNIALPDRQPKETKIKLSKSHGWYDFSIRVKGRKDFEKRYAGRAEDGTHGKTDPAMGA